MGVAKGIILMKILKILLEKEQMPYYIRKYGIGMVLIHFLLKLKDLYLTMEFEPALKMLLKQPIKL